MEKLTKAKQNLIFGHPFYASLLLSMDVHADASIKTFATNGKFIKYNPDFVETLSLPEVTFVLAHEVMHCVFNHMTRRGSRDAKRWNIAGDYIINDLLVAERIGVMPAQGLLDSDLVKRGNGTTEGVYGLLPEDQDGEGPGPGDAGGSLDDCQDAAQDEAGQSQAESEMRVKIVQAANAAKMQGKLSGGLKRLVEEMIKTRQDWRALLRRFMSERTKQDYSFAKPKRRFLADDIYLPGLTGEKMGQVVVAVDCSGSIDTAMLNEFADEIKGICEDVKPSELKVIYFDSEVSHVDTFSPDDEIKISAHGGGGTDFAPIFENIEQGESVPTCVVVLTDLYGPFGSLVPDYPVLWACTSTESQVPFGDVIRIQS